MVFHTKERMDDHTRDGLKESPAVVWLPLVILAIPSVVIGYLTVSPLLFDAHGFFHDAIYVMPSHDPLHHIGHHFHGPLSLAIHAFSTVPFWLAIAGIATAYYCYVIQPSIPKKISENFAWLHRLLLNKYGIDDFNQAIFAGGTRGIGQLLWRVGDVTLIDGLAVNGSAKLIGMVAKVVRFVQTGYLYHYALAMILGLVGLIAWILMT